MGTKQQHDLRKILNELKVCVDRGTTYKLLLKVRMDYIGKSDDIQKFVELGGVQIFINHLKRPNENILDVVLSALGNVCMYKEGAVKGLDNNILPSLNSILCSVSSKSSIKLRCVRLLGNLAQHMNQTTVHIETSFKIMLNNLCNEFDEILGSETVEENVSYITMLIRTVRNLWKNRQAFNTFITRGVIKKVMIILYSCFEHPNVSSIDEPTSVIRLGDTVILKRGSSPDRIVTREKFLTLIHDIDNQKNSDIMGYEPIRDPTSVNLHECQVIDKKDMKTLLSGILKLLEIATNHASISVVTQILSCPSSNQCFVSLINTNDISVVLKIIASIVTFQITKQVMTTLDVVTHVSSFAMSERCSNKDLCNSIKILCNLTVDACNRGKLRRSGVFSTLIKICNESTNEEETEMILVAFYQFRFDHLSLDSLLKEGIILMLIRLLQRHLKENKHELKHEQEEGTAENEQKKNKRKQDVDEGSLPRLKSLRESSPDIILNFSNKYLTAQNAYGSPFLRSPPGSPASSSGYSSANIQDSPNYTYSPVCSDSEGEDNDKECEPTKPEQEVSVDAEEPKEIFDISSLMYDENSLGSLTSCEQDGEENVESKFPEKSTQVTETKFDLVECVLKLLLELSKRNATHTDFVRVSTLDTFLNVYSKVETAQKDVTQVLKKILKQIHNFIPILKQNFIFKLYESRRLTNCLENCSSCAVMECEINDLLATMGESAQSGYGIGELAHFLLRGESDLKMQAAIITMYLIKCNKSLYKFLFVHNALDIVLNLIFNDAANKMMANYASTGFTVMAHNLNITVVSANDEFHAAETTVVDYDETKDYKQVENNVQGENCVTFIAKNNEKIVFNRELLMQASDFFDTMFKSDFKEAQENTVNLCNISASGGVKYFLLLINETLIEKTTTVHVNRNMKSCLEAYGLAKLYLLSELETLLLNIVKKVINHKNVITVLEYSFEHYNSEILSISINYYLNSGYTTGEEKRRMFIEAYSSAFQKQWLERLKDTILLKVNYGE